MSQQQLLLGRARTLEHYVWMRDLYYTGRRTYQRHPPDDTKASAEWLPHVVAYRLDSEKDNGAWFGDIWEQLLAPEPIVWGNIIGTSYTLCVLRAREAIFDAILANPAMRELLTAVEDDEDILEWLTDARAGRIDPLEAAAAMSGWKVNLRDVYNTVIETVKVDDVDRVEAGILCEYGRALRAGGASAETEPAVVWSKPRGPSEWANVFQCSAATMTKRLKGQVYRNMKLSPKSYAIHVADLPADCQEQQKRRP